MEKTPQGKALDELGYDRICCRRMFLADQPVAYDLSNKIAPISIMVAQSNCAESVSMSHTT